MTKIRKMRRMPAAMEDYPKMRKIVANMLPTRSASSKASCFTGFAVSPVPTNRSSRLERTASVLCAPSMASPGQ